MHDPSTHVTSIPIPFTGQPIVLKGGRVSSWYYSPLVTIWHDDPETDGSDDSCGWFGPKTSDEDRAWARAEGASEWKFMFGPEFGGMHSASAFEVVYTVWTIIARRRFKRTLRSGFSRRELAGITSLVAGYPSDTIHQLVDEAHTSEEKCADLFGCVLRNYLRLRRPWYRHPRWHVHHWRLQWHPVQAFKRWAFSRCATCGRRFPWGYAPVSHSWHGAGPRWFRSEGDVHHHECAGSGIAAVSG